MNINLKEISQILAVEMIFFPQVMLDEKLAMAWLLHFNDCTAQEFQGALHLAIQKNKTGFPPTPGSVREIISEGRKTPEDLETAEEAWASMWKRNDGSVRAKATARLIHDWEAKNYWDLEKEVPWKQKEFIRIYNGLKNKDQIMLTQGILNAFEDNKKNLKLSVITNNLVKKLGV